VKHFRYKLGHEAGATMTVGELKKALDDYPDEMPVILDWEGVNAFVNSSDWRTGLVHKGEQGDECECLLIWAEHF
jgi:hypothetical protein